MPCRYLLSCLLLVTYKPARCSLSSPCSRSYYLPDSLSPGPYCCLLCLAIFLVLCHVQAGVAIYALFTSFPSTSPSVVLGIMLSMRNKTVQLDHVFLSPRMPIMFSGQTDRHMDTRSDELPLNEQMWGSLTLTPNNTHLRSLLSFWASNTAARTGATIMRPTPWYKPDGQLDHLHHPTKFWAYFHPLVMIFSRKI